MMWLKKKAMNVPDDILEYKNVYKGKVKNIKIIKVFRKK